MRSRQQHILLLAAFLAVGCSPSVDGQSTTAPVDTQAALDTGAGPVVPPSGPWSRLEQDNLHDTGNPALPFLQQPEEALSVLPRASEGNNVDWVQALRSGMISPRTNIYPETKITVLDQDVLMEDTAGMPIVLFPHKPHTEWLDCANCHDRIFVAKRGANPVDMRSILEGRFCGQCHGAVAFPLTQCARCHSVDRGPEISLGNAS